jgi:hypothetical protein
MNGNEKPVLATPAHEKPPTTPASMTEGNPPRKSTRSTLLVAELRAAALALSPGRVVFVGPSGSLGWFRVERLDALKARVTHVSEAAVAETLLEEADFLAASPLGGVA